MGKGENADYHAYSPFPTMFSKVFFSGPLKVRIVWSRDNVIYGTNDVLLQICKMSEKLTLYARAGIHLSLKGTLKCK